MGLKDYTDSHVAIAVGATAMVCSSRMRKMLRSGAVHGVAGALIAGDAVASFARGVGRGAQQAAASASASTEMEAQNEVENADVSMADVSMADMSMADMSLSDDGAADALAQADEKTVSEARLLRTKAHVDDDIALVEAHSDE